MRNVRHDGTLPLACRAQLCGSKLDGPDNHETPRNSSYPFGVCKIDVTLSRRRRFRPDHPSSAWTTMERLRLESRRYRPDTMPRSHSSSCSSSYANLRRKHHIHRSENATQNCWITNTNRYAAPETPPILDRANVRGNAPTERGVTRSIWYRVGPGGSSHSTTVL